MPGPARLRHMKEPVREDTQVFVGWYEPDEDAKFAVKRIDVAGLQHYADAEVVSLRRVIDKLRTASACPYVAAPTAVLKSASAVYITMPLYPPRTLQDRRAELTRAKHPGVPLRELLGYMRCVAEGLDHLHRLGIVHGDVKPANVLLFDVGKAAICDFGFDWPPPSPLLPYIPAYTIEYVAPEMFKEQHPSRKRTFASDQYSLAAVYLELRTGTLAHDIVPLDMPYTMTSIATGKPTVRVESEAERDVLLKALSADPRDRYDSCAEFVSALAEATHTTDLTVDAPVIAPLWPQVPKKAWVVEPLRLSNGLIGAFIAAVVVASLAGVAALWVWGVPGREGEPGRQPATADTRPTPVREPVNHKPPEDGKAAWPTETPDPLPETKPGPVPELPVQIPATGFSFGGLNWRPSHGWSPDPATLWTDRDGQLRMRLHQREVLFSTLLWTAVNVTSDSPVGFGKYRFELATGNKGRFRELDSSVVFRFALTSGEGQLVTFDLSAWGDQDNRRNGQFLVGSHRGIDAPNIRLFGFGAYNKVAVELDWRADSVTARCTDPEKQTVFCKVKFESPEVVIPDASKQSVHIHLGFWLHDSKVPVTGLPQEVVLSALTYSPINTDSD